MGAGGVRGGEAPGKPVFLSIGYAACHWCHVMAHESFEDEATAAVLNEVFVCMKVDREERPDVDDVYMAAVQMTTGRGGWPMRSSCSPTAGPSSPAPTCGPQDSSRRHDADRRRCRRPTAPALEAAAEEIADAVREQRGRPEAARRSRAADADLVRCAVERAVAEFDRARGGFDRSPKFPPHGHAARSSSIATARPPASAGSRMATQDPRRHGRRRRPRPGRRRLPPLQHRRRVAPARTSRRCSTTTRSSRTAYARASPSRRTRPTRDVVRDVLALDRARDGRRGRRLRLEPRRRHRGRGGPHLHLDRRRGARRAARRPTSRLAVEVYGVDARGQLPTRRRRAARPAATSSTSSRRSPTSRSAAASRSPRSSADLDARPRDAARRSA